MTRIIATGKYLNSEITVEVENDGSTLVLTMYGDEVSHLQEHFEECISEQPAMGGTYYPEPDSMLCAFNVLQNTFFDSTPEIIIEGDIGEIPHEDGVIY